MKTLLFYLLQVIVTSGILYGYYHFALRNKRFHRYNRFYLLTATILSITVPFLNIPVYFTQSATESSFVLQTLTVISSAGREEPVVAIANSQSYTNWLTWENLSTLFYILIATLVLLRIIFSLLKISRIIKTNPVEQLDKIHFVNTTEPGTPFSFFRWLFWNKKIELLSEKGQQIFRHELFHIKQKHSWDIIYIELLTILFWINPFFHLVKKEVKAIHEFLADQFAVSENKKWQYAELLLMQVLNTNQQLVNPFFHNQIKRRIAMITTSQKTSYQYLRKLMLLPIAAITIALFAFSYNSKISDKKYLENDKLFTVVIDAGHGGKDAGVIASDGTTEKDIVLAIAQKIKMFNNNENIKIVLTREDDLSPELQSRIESTAINKADLFISLHVNAEPDKKAERSGFELVVSKKNNPFESQNKIIATILLNHFSNLYTTKMEILQRETGIWVLDNAPCPSALIECGYMTNKKDLDYIKDQTNQEKIAKGILSSIAVFANNLPAYKQAILEPSGNSIKPNDTDALILDKVEIEATFPGGDRKWREYVEKTLNGNIPTMNNAPVGTYTTVVIFIVDKEGNISDVKALTAHGFGMEKEVIRVIKNGPKWLPAIQNGRQVTSYRIQPITFVVRKSIQNEDDPIMIFNKVEIPPTFPDGDAAWRKYLQSNINPLVPVDSGAPAGIYKVIVQFIVAKDGSISDITCKTQHGYGMENEAMRLIRSGPKWNPATQNGRIVTAYVQQPVTFQISEEVDDTPIKVNESSTISEISVNTLKKISVYELLQLAYGTEILSYQFTIDDDNGNIEEVPNTGSQFNSITKMLISKAKAGKIFTIDMIRIKENGVEKRIPSKVYKVIN